VTCLCAASYPQEGRTALHYCYACKDADSVWDLLIDGGCDVSICDKKGNPAAYYLEHSAEIELPEAEIMPRRRKSTGKESEYRFSFMEGQKGRAD